MNTHYEHTQYEHIYYEHIQYEHTHYELIQYGDQQEDTVTQMSLYVQLTFIELI